MGIAYCVIDKNKTKMYFKAMLEVSYLDQVIDEACNADMGFNNHFRRVMTVGECQEAEKQADVWERYARTL